LSVAFFFFQAEDGIRAKLVTGVQTCALPICGSSGTPRRAHTATQRDRTPDSAAARWWPAHPAAARPARRARQRRPGWAAWRRRRSEERRVGKGSGGGGGRGGCRGEGVRESTG